MGEVAKNMFISDEIKLDAGCLKFTTYRMNIHDPFNPPINPPINRRRPRFETSDEFRRFWKNCQLLSAAKITEIQIVG
jgi:hypothetical protein